MEIGNNVEEHQEYISGPYIALINGTTQQREPNKKLKNIIVATLIAIFIVLVITVSLYVANNTSDKIDDFSPGDSVDPTTKEYKKSFEDFKKKYNKTYSSKEEEDQRFEIYKQNMNFIKITNSQGFSYVLEMNEFGDLSKEEFMARFTGYRKDFDDNERVFKAGMLGNELEENFSIPNSVNWVEAGCVNPIRNQKNCGSCWAFSAVAALEGAICAQTDQGLPSLSEQQLVDCSKKNGNYGCNGGTMGLAFQYAIRNKYLCTNDDYPYYAEEKMCRESLCENYVEVPVKTYRYVFPRNANSLKRALARYGPISVAVQADQTPFQFYKSGVFDAPCGTKVNHGVVLVGYDIDESTNKEYWLVRNSWGDKWGEKGYIKLALHSGKKGTCGILVEPVYPIISQYI